ncbi:MAG: YaaC family protein [Ktedonobacteraceae bacterium]
MTDSWERLSLYESRDLLSRFYQNRHGGQLSAGKSYEIIAHLAQGRGFFASARQSSELARPLLLYYGVYALSRGLILFLDTKSRECSLPPSHGIEAEGWQHALAQSIDQLPNLPLKITGGTFSVLSEATSNIDRCRVHGLPIYAKPYHWLVRGGTTTVATPTIISLKMVLERVPDLSTIFTTTFGSSPKCFQAILFIHSEDVQTDVHILETELGFPDVDDMRSAFGLPADVSLQPSDAPWQYGVNNSIYQRSIFYRINHSSSSELLAKLPPIKSDREGNTYVVELMPNNLDLSSLSLLYLIAYSMGMLARYYPSKWLSLLNSSKGDFAFPLMKAATTVVEDRFPQLVLQELEGAMSSLV